MISTLCRIADHKNQREDNLHVVETDQYIMGIVSDGCSTGKDSAFSSQTYVYAFQTAIRRLDGYESIVGPIQGIPDTFTNFFLHSLTSVAKLFNLNIRSNPDAQMPFDMLATAIMFGYDKTTKRLVVEAYGDGTVYANGKPHVLDQDNKPDYLGYYLTDDQFLVFNRHREMRTKLIIDDVENFVICSDGIDKFRTSSLVAPGIEKPVEYLLSDIVAPLSLNKNFNILKKKGWFIIDDLSVIAYDSKLPKSEPS